MIIKNLKQAAKDVGINAFITNSEERLDAQLTRLTRQEQLPIMLISWDIRVGIEFDPNGFISDPPVDIVALLLTKPEDMTKEEAEKSAEEMATLFIKFLEALNAKQRVTLRTSLPAITNASFQYAPLYGAAKHSGVLGRFTVRNNYVVPC